MKSSRVSPVFAVYCVFATVAAAETGGELATRDEGPKNGREIALGEVRKIAAALKAYENEYGKLPPVVPRKNPREWVEGSTVGAPEFGGLVRNSALFYVLRARAEGNNPDDRLNKRKTRFFEGVAAADASRPRGGFADGEKASAELRGCYFDPWGREYMVRLDEFGTGKLKTPDNRIVEAIVVVWSVGPDGKSGTLDDVVAWK